MDNGNFSQKGSLVGTSKGNLLGSPKNSLLGSPKNSLLGSPKNSLLGSPKSSLLGSPKSNLLGSPKNSGVQLKHSMILPMNDFSRDKISTLGKNFAISVEKCDISKNSYAGIIIRKIYNQFN